MSLQTKILNLKLEAALALRHAQGWQKLIDLYGEDKAQAFYLHLGLNHLPRKSFDYDGLTLSREPKPHEALQVKAIASAQESSKERLSAMMLSIRNELVSEATAKLEKLSPSKYHTLIVTVDKAGRILLRDLVTETFNDGRLLITVQRNQKCKGGGDHDWALHAPYRCYDCLALPVEVKADDDDFDDELDDLTDITTARLANDVQARIIGAAARFAMLGQAGQTLVASVTSEIRSASTVYVDRAATGLANRTINLGRSVEAAKYDWERVEYSALLDTNVCEFCAEFDGQEARSEDDLEPVPNQACSGLDNCRCFHIFIAD